jgi:muramoyltetrapeptide carboxypeptidase
MKKTQKIVPKPLQIGDKVALIAPAGAIYEKESLEIATENLKALGLEVVLGQYAANKNGYLAGTDAERVADLHAAFADKTVKAALALRGGWGCGRLLPLIDWELLRQNPKIFAGFSDVTTLLNAIYAKTGLVTYHSPMATSVWNNFSVEYFKKILFDNELLTWSNPQQKGDALVQLQDRITTIKAGEAIGEMVGGNLTVLCSLLGSEYLPDFAGKILFLEEVNEEIYRVDRLFCQLALAGILDKVAGVVLGKFTNCGHGDRFSSLTLVEVFENYLLPLHIPVFAGSMIGHIPNKFTIPVGIQAKINANQGTITLLEAPCA